MRRGNWPATNIAFAGSKFWSVPNVICAAALDTVLAWFTCMNVPPKLKLCVPLSQLRVLSMFQFVVLRSSRPVRLPGEVRPNMLAFVKLQPNPPCCANISRVRFGENSSGDHCQPPFTSLTMLDDSVERRLVEPTVRYDGDWPKFGKPGNGASLLLRMSGLVSRRPQ